MGGGTKRARIAARTRSISDGTSHSGSDDDNNHDHDHELHDSSSQHSSLPSTSLAASEQVFRMESASSSSPLRRLELEKNSLVQVI